MVVDESWHNGHIQVLLFLLCGANGGVDVQIAAYHIQVFSFVLRDVD